MFSGFSNTVLRVKVRVRVRVKVGVRVRVRGRSAYGAVMLKDKP